MWMSSEAWKLGYEDGLKLGNENQNYRNPYSPFEQNHHEYYEGYDYGRNQQEHLRWLGELKNDSMESPNQQM